MEQATRTLRRDLPRAGQWSQGGLAASARTCFIRRTMAELKDLLRDLTRALEANDHAASAAVRRTIVENHGGQPEAAEAGFKLGLHLLFKERDIDGAVSVLRGAAKAKHPVWSPQARISLGQLLMRQGKHQQAVFELRRVAGSTQATLVSAQAAGLVVIALREAQQGPQAERARAQYLDILERLTDGEGSDVERALAQHMLGLEHKHDGRRDLARPLLAAALESGALPKDEHAQAERAIAEL